jgi:hypothetical protein
MSLIREMGIIMSTIEITYESWLKKNKRYKRYFSIRKCKDSVAWILRKREENWKNSEKLIECIFPEFKSLWKNIIDRKEHYSWLWGKEGNKSPKVKE